MSTRTDPRRVVAIAVAIALVPYALLVARFGFVCDDAYISFRYARNLAAGHGLVYNLGESPPVEGYSNFLWTLWLALGLRLGVAAEVLANATSIACGVVLVALVTRFVVRRFGLALVPAIASALCLATLPPIVLWSTGGLESLAFTLAFFLVFERLALDPERPRGVAAGLAALAVALLRTDGAAWALVALVAGARPTGGRRARRALAVACAILVLGAGAHVAWRVGYHEDWLSNTARIKAGLSALRLERGARYAASFLLAVPSVALVLVAAIALRGRPERELALRAALVVAVAFAYAVFTGGDFMPLGRFVLVAMPFVVVVFAATLAALAGRARARLAYAAATIGLSLLACFEIDVVPIALRAKLHFRWNDPEFQGEIEQWRTMRARAEEWRRIGRALALVARPDESIVLGGIGAIGYESGLVVFDRFGLVDREVARRAVAHVRASPGHDKGVPIEFFLEREPDYLGAWLAPGAAPPEAGLPPGWSSSTLGQRTEIERTPLPASADFRAGTELRVLRYHPPR